MIVALIVRRESDAGKMRLIRVSASSKSNLRKQKTVHQIVAE
jgi:hypothetical protein